MAERKIDKVVMLDLVNLPVEEMKTVLIREPFPAYDEAQWYKREEGIQGRSVSVLFDFREAVNGINISLAPLGIAVKPFELIQYLAQYCNVYDIEVDEITYMLNEDIKAILHRSGLLPEITETLSLDDCNYANKVWEYFNAVRLQMMDALEELDVWTESGYNPYIPVKEYPGGLYLFTLIPHAVVYKKAYKHHAIISTSKAKQDHPEYANSYNVIEYRLVKDSPRARIATLKAEIEILNHEQRKLEKEALNKYNASRPTIDLRDPSTWTKEMLERYPAHWHARV